MKARKKYVCKNIGEFKHYRTCTHPDCSEVGFVSYRNDPPGDNGGVKVEFRCIAHVHWVKEPKAVKEAKNPNLYTVCDDPSALLNLTAYFARG